MTKLLVNNIKLMLDESESLAFDRAKKVLARAGLGKSKFEYSIYRRSIDARNKKNILLVYSVLAVCDSDLKLTDNKDIKILSDDSLNIQYGTNPLISRPLVVGMGPAGMFCALMLAENGYRPIIIDRGDNVTNRTIALENFVKTGNLDVDSNVQFGAGGAGTFSDGKLTTRINDERCSYVLSRFVNFGAPNDILTKAKPHIGTDILTKVVDSILSRIEELGGTVIYRCRMDDLHISTDSIKVSTTKGDFNTNNLILAIGHSARDTYRMLLSKGFVVEPKPYSIGVRVEHLKKDIDSALYGDFAGHKKLGAGEYNLSDTTQERGVYTFCMCPGGEVVPATSQELGVCVNGMSKFARDGVNSNCAVNVSIFTNDYGNDPYRAIEFQESLEKAAYAAGGGDYCAPIQLMSDFINESVTREPSRILPTYSRGVKVTNINEILPDFISNRLKEGFVSFDKKINGFACDDAVITGIETRTSAPVRIMRSERLTSLSDSRIYPCGEGAGYAGGIMSSAIDGIKVALEIMKNFKP